MPKQKLPWIWSVKQSYIFTMRSNEVSLHLKAVEVLNILRCESIEAEILSATELISFRI
jgi:hypothetical protein